jgi:phosphotransferase system enzyme I (PtsP)
VHLRPTPDIEATYAEKVRFRAKRQEQYRLLRDKAAETRDGRRINLLMNAGLLVDLPHLDESGAEGIGLFRTELQFMISSKMPKLGEQTALYGDVIKAASGKPVTFRTLDVGGDKVLPYLRTAAEEENPAMGWRAIRLGLDRPALLRTQLRALLRAAAGRELKVMFPMVAAVEEFDAGKKLVEAELRYLGQRGHGVPERIEVGAMLEVPSLLFDIDAILRRVDFLSVGSNDLLQYLFAADRTNPRVADRFDPLSRPVLRALKHVVDHGRAAGTPVTLCGEMAARPLEALALIGLGFRSISLSAAAVGPVKAMLLDVDAGEIEAALAPCLDGADDVPPREALREFASRRGLQV